MEGEREVGRPKRHSRFTCPKISVTDPGNTKQVANDAIQIILGDATFYAAREILLEHSMYFRRALENNYELCKIDITVLQIGTEVFEVLHHWMFGRNLGLTITNVAAILDAAHKLQMPEAASVCANFMESELRLDHHWNVTCDKQACDIKSFQQIIQDQCFLELSAEQVCQLLSNDNIDIRKEKEVFDAAVRWLRHDWEQRKEHVARIIGCVRFGLMSDKDILDISRRNLNLSVMETPECQAFALYGLLYHSAQRAGNAADRKRFAPQHRFRLLKDEPRASSDRPVVTTPRKCHKADRGDCVSTSASSLSNSDPSEFCSVSENTVKKSLLLVNEWDVISGDDKKVGPLTCVQTSTLQNTDFFCVLQQEVCTRQMAGGTDTSKGDGTALQQNIQLNNLKNVSPLQDKLQPPCSDFAALKLQHTFQHFQETSQSSESEPAQLTKTPCLSTPDIPRVSAVDGPFILAIGTVEPIQNKPDTKTTVFMFSPLQNLWRLVGYLPKPTIQAGTVPSGQDVYFIGGSVVRYGNCESTVLTPSKATWAWGICKGSWQKLADMNYARAHHGVAVCSRKIYAVGGLGIRKRLLATVESFSLITLQWTLVSTMPSPCMSAAVATYRKHVWVCGGVGHCPGAQAPQILSTVQQFCPSSGKWRKFPNLPAGYCFSTLCQHAGQLLLIGGVIKSPDVGLCSTSSVKAYHEASNLWVASSAMNLPRHAAGAAVLGDSLYIVGGASTKSQMLLTATECLSGQQNKWIEDIAPLPVSFIGVSCVAVNVQSPTASVANKKCH